MRFWLAATLISAALAVGCASPAAEPLVARPPRSETLQFILSESDAVDRVRVNANAWLKPYAVSAAGGLNGIRRQLDQIGPVSEVTGQRFDGLTTWGLHSTFSYNDSRDSCSIRNATIEVEAVITLPELQEGSLLPPHELTLWQAYVEQLRAHEDGHVSIYLAAAQDLRDEYLQVGAMADCRQLAAALTALSEAKIAAVRAADQRFDAETGHGALFPSP